MDVDQLTMAEMLSAENPVDDRTIVAYCWIVGSLSGCMVTGISCNVTIDADMHNALHSVYSYSTPRQLL